MATWKQERVLDVFCAFLAMHYVAGNTTAKLQVEYPVNGNYSVVRVTCRDLVGDKLNGAEFLKNGTVLTSGPASHQVTITERGDGELSFIFTQEQEGVFSCGGEDSMSAGVGLAGK